MSEEPRTATASPHGCASPPDVGPRYRRQRIGWTVGLVAATLVAGGTIAAARQRLVVTVTVSGRQCEVTLRNPSWLPLPYVVVGQRPEIRLERRTLTGEWVDVTEPPERFPAMDLFPPRAVRTVKVRLLEPGRYRVGVRIAPRDPAPRAYSADFVARWPDPITAATAAQRTEFSPPARRLPPARRCPRCRWWTRGECEECAFEQARIEAERQLARELAAGE